MYTKCNVRIQKHRVRYTFLTGSLSFDKVKRKGNFLQERSDSKKGVGPKNLFETLRLNVLSQIAIFFNNYFTDKRNKAK